MEKLTIKQMQRHQQEISKFLHKCDCSHKVLIPYNKDFEICHWCGQRVYRSDAIKFKYKLKETINKRSK